MELGNNDAFAVSGMLRLAALANIWAVANFLHNAMNFSIRFAIIAILIPACPAATSGIAGRIAGRLSR